MTRTISLLLQFLILPSCLFTHKKTAPPIVKVCLTIGGAGPIPYPFSYLLCTL